MAEESLLVWAGKQASWMRDALRRHAVGGGRLSAADKSGIIARVRHQAGIIQDPAPDCVNLDASHLSTPPKAGAETTLVSFGPVENLNRLAPDQILQFALNGLTVIYGDNGSGKSGYARIAKKLCRSVTDTELLGNVFEKEDKPPAKVKVRYRLHGQSQITETDWTDGDPPPVAIADIAVFDSANARFYVDEENRISFLPHDIALLQSHVEYCVEMDEVFDAEIKALDKQLKVALPTGYAANGTVAALLAKLDGKAKPPYPTIDEIKAAAIWTEDDTRQLAALEASLANNPGMMAARARRVKGALETATVQINSIESALPSDTATRVKDLRANEATTAKAAKLAATDQFASAPLHGVGGSAWRLLYEHAKAFAAEIGIDATKLPDNEGDPCVMCQEPLTAKGAERLKGFNNFVAGAATKAADAARAAHESAIKVIKELQIPAAKMTESVLAEYTGMSDERKDASAILMAYFAAAQARRDALMKAISDEEFAALTDLAASPLEAVTLEITALDAEAEAFEKAAKEDDGRKAEVALAASLRDRQNLSNDLATIISRRDNLEQMGKLKKCKDEVKTTPLSLKVTNLRRSTVMAALAGRIQDEIKAFDLTHIPFEVSDRSKDGDSYFGVNLETKKNVPNNKVLSDGEQRALALACFLGEATTHTAKHGLIIDDPVSSLDHIRIRKVAERLVNEAAKGRQMIIFTHNIHFFNEVLSAAAKIEPQVPVHENYIRSSGNDTFGLISEKDKPWIIMPVMQRIDLLSEKLKGFADITDFSTDDWRIKTESFYSDLRKTWERLVEDTLLGKTVERFNTDVKTQSLKGVVVDDNDYKTIFFAMKRASERSGHDMADGKIQPVPKPSDMKADLDVIEKYRAEIAKRKNETAKRREALEEPPKAQVA